MVKRVGILLTIMVCTLVGIASAGVIAEVDFTDGIPGDWTYSERVTPQEEGGNRYLFADHLDGLTQFGPQLALDGGFRVQFKVRVQNFRGVVSRFQLVFPHADDSGMVYVLSIGRDTVKFGPAPDPGKEPSPAVQVSYAIAQNRWVDVVVAVSSAGKVELVIDGNSVLSGDLDQAVSGFYFWSWTTIFAVDDVQIQSL